MSDVIDIHAYEHVFKLNGNGFLTLKVFVSKRINTVNLLSVPIYLIKTAMKISIYNTQNFAISPGVITDYSNYPALFQFTKSIICSDQSQVDNFRLLDYSPKTVNSSITTSRSDSDSSTLTNSVQQSVGSTTSQTNSFGVNVQGGIMMELPMLTAGISYEHAWSSSQSQGRASSSGTDRGHQLGMSDSFSIKDWGIYASADKDKLSTAWVCGQEYPWDILQFRSLGPSGNIELPDFVTARMLTGDCLLPPSQLSQFGTDFTFAADWSYQPNVPNVDMNADLMTLSIDVEYVLGSHQRVGISTPYTVQASLSQPAKTPCTITLKYGDLELLALNPIVCGRNDASLNFEKLPASRFPAQGTNLPLTVTSPTNTLLAVAPGFGPGMIVDVAKASASFILYFKTTDTVGDVNLFIKHWKLDSSAITLTMKVNGCMLPIQLVDSFQGEGGTKNRTLITLRSTDYMDEDFADFIVVGLNTIEIIVNSVPNVVAQARYCLSAVVVS